jgi:hypothetical protein
MYEMDIAVRNLLLKELKEQFGQERLDKLAEFLMDYVKQRLTADDPDTQDLAQAQEWTALAYTKPNEAARKLAEALSVRVKQHDMAEMLRLASLVETFAEPLVKAGFKPLLVYAKYAKGITSFARGNLQETLAELGEVLEGGNKLEVEGVNLHIPDLLMPKQGINYTTLSNLLIAGHWKEADEETYRVMLLLTEKEKIGSFKVEDISKFPCEALRTIDKLWVQHSYGCFGFSIQKQVYESEGNNYSKLAEQVGWRLKDKWLLSSELTFDRKAPTGHLPACWLLLSTQQSKKAVNRGKWREQLYSSLTQRLENCGIS